MSTTEWIHNGRSGIILERDDDTPADIIIFLYDDDDMSEPHLVPRWELERK